MNANMKEIEFEDNRKSAEIARLTRELAEANNRHERELDKMRRGRDTEKEKHLLATARIATLTLELADLRRRCGEWADEVDAPDDCMADGIVSAMREEAGK